MNFRKLALPLSILMVLFSSQIMAQEYNTAVGAKIYVKNGTLGGFNIKHNLTYNQGLEGSLLFGSGLVALEGLYNFQGDIEDVEGLSYFAGGGAILGFSTSSTSKTNFGLRLTGGAEYKVPETPISVSLGIDPFFTIAPNAHTSLALGLGFRYILE